MKRLITSFAALAATTFLFAALYANGVHAQAAQTKTLSRQETLSPPMREAVQAYFSFNQQDALNKFIAISKDTGEKDSFLNAAYIALELGNTRLAVDIMSAALKKYPQDLTVLEFAGEAYLDGGYYPNAENVFARLTEKNDKTEFYFINLARAQMGLKQFDLAEINLKMAASGQNHKALANFMLGELYAEQKKYPQAARAYKKVIDYDSQFTEARKRYADVMVKMKKYNEAWQTYADVSSVDSSSAQVKSSMEEISSLVSEDVKNAPIKFESEVLPVWQHTIVKKPYETKKTPHIRVGLGAKINGAPVPKQSIEFSTSHFFTATDKNGKVLLKKGAPNAFWKVIIENKRAYLVSPKGRKTPFGASLIIKQSAPDYNSHTTIIKNILVGQSTTWESRQTREYRGYIEFIYNRALNGLIAVNHLNLEEYVYGVISAEMPSSFPTEALKAQAVIARTYALRSLGKHKQWGYDVCDTQHCQVYGGVKAEREKTNSAAEATNGVVLTYKGKPIEAVFSSNCGGYTQSSKEAGWYPHEYLKPVSDYKDFNTQNLQPYQFKELLQHSQPAFSRYYKSVSPSNFRWTRLVDEEQIRSVVARRKDIGKIKAIVPLKRGVSGYVNGVKIMGTKGSLTLTKEHEIKKYLALGLLKSTYFIVEPNYVQGKLDSFIFYGGGWGHGVGLCQTGTGGRADEGQTFRQILRHYYTDVDITDLNKKPSSK